QDAIKKGLAALRSSEGPYWEVPYLPIDPLDIGRSYEPIIRINSQSGKGGVAYILEANYGYSLPRRLQVEFSKIVQQITDGTSQEIAARDIWTVFEAEYLMREEPYKFIEYELKKEHIKAVIEENGERIEVEGNGNGPIDAFADAMRRVCNANIRVADYMEHSMGSGADATAVSYVELETPEGDFMYGVGSDPNIVAASLKAMLSAYNRILNKTPIPTYVEMILAQAQENLAEQRP
ncbi:MAG: alpha-isopropylmalate synthase regulatory domain-containing protein, partial [Pseudomonadota bacterium]